jgi:hypothetical protein
VLRRQLHCEAHDHHALRCVQVKVKREVGTSSQPAAKVPGRGGGAGAPMRIAIPRIKPGAAAGDDDPSATSDGGPDGEASLSVQRSEHRPRSHARAVATGAQEGGLSQADVREWIEERYHATALPRPLTSMDVDALLELAGFPQARSCHCRSG